VGRDDPGWLAGVAMSLRQRVRDLGKQLRETNAEIDAIDPHDPAFNPRRDIWPHIDRRYEILMELADIAETSSPSIAFDCCYLILNERERPRESLMPKIEDPRQTQREIAAARQALATTP
jgi:hypothetical protein